ncbi:MAG: S-layer homology domain-containing protein, partial [Clostridiales bacterium]|nr:S-layer homology domain-containing protein [Clostridiales bacterium]
VTYKEAVDVMTAAGIFNGGDGNNFNPDATLNREQAAKIITYMLVGQEKADKLTTTVAPYADVAATRWSAGSIAYCTNEGIIAGDGNGRFNPTAGVTGLQFAKMLLVALGYDAKIENLVGNSWAINTASLALGDADLDNGMEEIALSAALTREQAAQMAFNAFKADLVKYANKGTNITLSDGSTVVIGATPAATYKDAKADNNLGETANLTQFAEKYCEKLSLSHPTDAFERPTNEWTYDKVKVGSYADEADLTYTKEVKLGDIYKDLGLSDTIAAGNVTFHVDGAAEATPESTYALSKGDSTKIGGNGVLTEVFYDKDAGTVKITIMHVYGGEISSVRAATASKDANVTVTPQNAGRGGNYETDKFAVDDVVLYTYSTKSGDTGVQSAVKAEQITGTLTGYTGGESVTVDGKTYEFNAAASTNYAVVLKYTDATTWDDAKARLLLTDGTTKDVNLKGNVKNIAGNAKVATNSIVSYTVNNKDQYELKVLTEPTTESNVTLTTKGNSTIDIGSVSVANGKTIFLVATENGDDTEYTAYTGIANVPTIKVGTTAAAVNAYVKSGTAATVVFIDATATSSTVESSSKNVIFVMGDSTVGSSYDSVKGTYWKYDAIVNGEITTIESAQKITSKGMYTTVAEDKNGVLTLSGNDGVTSGTGTDREANGAIGLNGSYYSYAKDCQVFFVDTDGNISTSSIGGISKDETNNVWFKVTDGDVTTIVIVDAVSSAKQLTGVKTVAVKASQSSTLTVDATGTVNESAKTFSGSVSGSPVSGDKIVFTPVVSAGASANEVTATYNGSSWTFSGPIVVTAEDGTTATYNGQ